MITLESGETIRREIRKHPFVMLLSAFSCIVAALIPLLLPFVFGAVSGVTPELVRSAAPLSIFLYSLWLLGIWTFFFLDWTDYYLDVWYITDRRIIDIEQKGLFRREIISLRYDVIQDVTIETHGFIQTMFDFGDIYVQTAGANRKIVLSKAAKPDEAKSEILALQNGALDSPQPVRIVAR